jgi:hypothetical protein
LKRIIGSQLQINYKYIEKGEVKIMDNLGLIIAIIALFAGGVYFVLGIISLIKKNGKAKKNFTSWGVASAVMIIGFMVFGANTDTTETASTPPKEETKELTAEEKERAKAQEKAEAEAAAKKEQEKKEAAEAKAKAEAEAKAKEDTKAEDDVPVEYKSALKKAESYAKTMNMSKIAIFEQLTSEYGEKFSPESAQYAMDNLEFDWKANALKKAESYSKTMHMSKQGIYEQLISENGEKFTVDEAQYAIDNLVADFNKNALEKAKSYQETMSMSPEAIRDQLTSEYGEKFTQEEADYAITNLVK